LADDESKEEELFTCQNVSCKKSFAKPLKAFDVRANQDEAYEACPFCLSKIEANDENVSNLSGGKPSASTITFVKCGHHLGYLCERSEKEHVPDECILCPDIVSCMLHSLKR
jgi:hypothetical protein